jgi:hypothetical protein
MGLRIVDNTTGTNGNTMRKGKGIRVSFRKFMTILNKPADADQYTWASIGGGDRTLRRNDWTKLRPVISEKPSHPSSGLPAAPPPDKLLFSPFTYRFYCIYLVLLAVFDD